MNVLLFILRSIFGGLFLSTVIYTFMEIKIHKNKEMFGWIYFVMGFSFVTFVLSCIMFGW